MKKLLLFALALAAGLTYYNYVYGVKRCALEWVDYAPDIGDQPVVIARALECSDFAAAQLYLKRVGRKQYVVYLQDSAGKRSPEIPLDLAPVIGNYIRGVQLREFNFKGYRVQWSNDGRLALDQERVTKIPLKHFQ